MVEVLNVEAQNFAALRAEALKNFRFAHTRAESLSEIVTSKSNRQGFPDYA